MLGTANWELLPQLHVRSVGTRTYITTVMSTLDIFSSAFAHPARLNIPGYWIVRVPFPSLFNWLIHYLF